MSGDQRGQAELFAIPDAYLPLWTLVPNAQDAARPVELDEPEPPRAARTPAATGVRVPGRLPVVGETARAS